ncbi:MULTISPECIES: ATP-dependent nuclease [unclassified Streptosporangium]|uniref:ATP-dependent nuclease n=1 Tax=unclassified Streptosporangium TaxID=2632669 RepID=UPI002E2B84F9|nr:MULTISPECIES: AAA family ATPase [unclassified Streptosporangium]
MGDASPPPTQSALTHEWNTQGNTDRGWPLFLVSVQIEGLRGWAGESIDLRYPVVAIAGENGAGKSTVLKAAAAAYGAQQRWAAFNPDDFFPKTPWDTVQGVTLKYVVIQGKKISTPTLRKRTHRWRGMPERPVRNVLFLDISRTQPINTVIGYGKLVAKGLGLSGKLIQAEEGARMMLSRIMGRSYTSSGMVTYENKQVGVVSTSNADYSNFHMGAGEDAIVDLVEQLWAAPNNSLIVIDEVEASLHPRSQRRLMRELFAVANKKRIQFILSTHSAIVLEQLPTEARVFIQRPRTGPHNVMYGVTPEFAMSLMDDVQHPELVLYCEDPEAVVVIDALIRKEMPEILRRIRLLPVGAASTVALLGSLAKKDQLAQRSLAAVDGDQKPSAGCLAIPGGCPPEKVVFGGDDGDAWTEVAQRLGVRPADLLDAVDDARQLENHHPWPGRIAERLGPHVRKSRVWEDAAAVWADRLVDPQERADFVNAIAGALQA